MSKNAEGNAFCDCCGRGPLKPGRYYIDHYEEHAPCSPSIKDFCAECHSDLLGHGLSRFMGWEGKMYEGGGEVVCDRRVYLSTLRENVENVLWRCRECPYITSGELADKIRGFCRNSGIENWEEVVDWLIRDFCQS